MAIYIYMKLKQVRRRSLGGGATIYIYMEIFVANCIIGTRICISLFFNLK